MSRRPALSRGTREAVPARTVDGVIALADDKVPSPPPAEMAMALDNVLASMSLAGVVDAGFDQPPTYPVSTCTGARKLIERLYAMIPIPAKISMPSAKMGR